MEAPQEVREQFVAVDRMIGAADFHGAIRLLHEVLAASEKHQRSSDAAMALNRIGRVYSSLGNPDLAIRYHLQSLALFEKTEDPRGLAETYNHIGIVWSEAENRPLAMQFKLKALDAARRSEDPRELSRAYNNIGEEYRLGGRYGDAREQYLRSLELDRQAGNKAYEAVAIHNLALVAAAEEKDDEARALFERSLALSVEAVDSEMEVETLILWGRLELKARSLAAAGSLLERALSRAEGLGSPHLLGMALEAMAAYQRELGQFSEAFHALERFTDIMGREFHEARVKRLLAVSIEREAEEVREESRRLETEAQELKRLIAEQVREIHAEKEEALRLRDRAEKTLEEFLRALASAIEAKDPCTGGHVDRVGGYARALAQRLGLPSAECHRIYLGAIVHDVGKIGVRDVVLNKPGKLDADEMEEMRRHPAVGYQILSRVHGLETAAEIAHCHHERWNGEGYPRKLRSTDVPLSARIVAIADFWDAITSHRPYRVAMPRQKALELMHSEREKTFDPDLFDLFMEGEPRIYELYDEEEGCTVR